MGIKSLSLPNGLVMDVIGPQPDDRLPPSARSNSMITTRVATPPRGRGRKISDVSVSNDVVVHLY